MFPGPYAAYSGRMMSGDYYKREEPLFKARLARKDAGIAKDLAKKSGFEKNGNNGVGYSNCSPVTLY